MKETHKLYKVDNFILINVKRIHVKVTHLMILLVLLNFERQRGGGGSLQWLGTYPECHSGGKGGGGGRGFKR